MPTLLGAALASVLITQPVLAAANPWLGTWKLNHDKSNMTAETYTIMKKGAGYTFDYGPVKFDVGEDGKDYPVVTGRTQSLKKIGDDEWLAVNKVNGVEVSRNTMKLSSDGKTQTETITGTQADGKTYKSEWTDQRVSGGPGLAGVWKGTNKSTEKDTMVYSDAGNGMLKIEHVEDKATMTVSLDGKPAHQSGPRANPEETISFNRVSPNELKYTIKIKEKTVAEGVRTVSADGKVLKDVSWLVTRPSEKETQIYEKQ